MTSKLSSVVSFMHPKPMPIESDTTHRYEYRQHKVWLRARPDDNSRLPSTVYDVSDKPTHAFRTAISPSVTFGKVPYRLKKGPSVAGPLRVVPGHIASDIARLPDDAVEIGSVVSPFGTEQVSGRPGSSCELSSVVFWKYKKDPADSWRAQWFNGPCWEQERLSMMPGEPWKSSYLRIELHAGLPKPIAAAVRSLPCDPPSDYALAMARSDCDDNVDHTAFLVDPTSLPSKLGEEKEVTFGSYTLMGHAMSLTDAPPVFDRPADL